MSATEVKIENRGNSKLFSVSLSLTESEAIELQRVKGFHISGHGFYDYKKTNTSTTWKCYRSCD